MTKLLANKVALVTGGNSGIGLATAQALIEAGAFVYITGRREPVLQQAVQQLGKNSAYVRADVSVFDDMQRVAQTIKEQSGQLDIVFANAGVGQYIALGEMTSAQIDQVLNTNIKGTILTVQAVLPLLTTGASIILNTSVTANLGLPNFSLYAASKAAVRSFIHSWTADLRDRQIRVNAVSPGVVPTPAATGELGRSAEQEQMKQQHRAQLTPLKRVGQVADISQAVLFLASDQSAFITGTEITVDGGLSAVFADEL